MNTKYQNRLDTLDKRAFDIEEEVALKMNITEGQEIWKYFQKFAVYDDLKDLYHRCVPAIASFEDKLQLIRDDLKRMQEIIRSFD